MNPPRRGKCSFRDSTRLCRVALQRGLPPLALLCGTAQCSASLSPPLAALSSAVPVVPCRTAARTLAACIALRHCPMLRFAFSAAGGAQLRRPGCAVSHCCADSRRLHCSAALPNAPLRFLRRWRRSAPPSRLCRVALLRGLSPLALLCGTAQCSASLSPPLAALSSAYPRPAD